MTPEHQYQRLTTPVRRQRISRPASRSPPSQPVAVMVGSLTTLTRRLAIPIRSTGTGTGSIRPHPPMRSHERVGNQRTCSLRREIRRHA